MTANQNSAINNPTNFSQSNSQIHADVVIIGAGIAGLVTALEIMDNDKKNNTNHRICILDRDKAEKFGGLAKQSFGGILFVDTPEQRKAGVKDSVDIALQDWKSFGEFGDNPEKEKWAWAWAEHYVNDNMQWIYHWLKERDVSYLPLPLWVERGLQGGGTQVARGGGNTVPRWHVCWGTGYGLIEALITAFETHSKRDNVDIHFNHHVKELLDNQGKVVGCRGTVKAEDVIEADFAAHASVVVIAAGGINGSMELVHKHWHKDWAQPPEVILNGSHQYADGTMHLQAEKLGANLTFLQNMWNYAAGVHHWRPQKPNHGLSLVPAKSALWLNTRGERIGPTPLVTAFDTRDLVTQICNKSDGYSWQLLNYKIAKKEFAISGSEFNHAIREKSKIGMAKDVLFGSGALVNEVIENCQDVVVADNLAELVQKMNRLNGDNQVDLAIVEQVVANYDAQIDMGQKYFNDDQLRRIAHTRQWTGDKLRTCKFQKINDPSAKPLIAIREYIVSRKSLGGIQTNLKSQVLTPAGEVIQGLYATGEATGFGGGGMNGLRGLEGTFLGGCIYSGRRAGKAIAAGG